jgi:all-trans-retinol 13,14-reductase
MFITGARYFVDGSQQLADEMAKVIRNGGGELFTRSKVVHIEAENKTVKWVRTEKGDVFEADTFISSIHPAVTLDLIDKNQIQKSYRKRIGNIKNTISSFTVFITFKTNAFKYLNHNYYYSKDYESIWKMKDYDFENEWPKGFMLLTPPHSDSQEYAKTAIVNTLMSFEDVREWEDSQLGKRGKDYEAFKEKCTNRILEQIESCMPGFKACVESTFAATPLTIRDYTASKEGTLYGTQKNINELVSSHISPRTKLKNLLLTGQNLNMHGILGVPLTAIQTCGELLGLNTLINKINDACEE